MFNYLKYCFYKLINKKLSAQSEGMVSYSDCLRKNAIMQILLLHNPN